MWLKRDFRLEDHAAFHFASTQSNLPVVVLYVIEPEYWQLPDTSKRQFDFIKQAILSLTKQLNDRAVFMSVRSGDVVDVLKRIHQHVSIKYLLSHEETGNFWTYERDKRVLSFCKTCEINWREFSQKAVVRGPLDRDKWKTSSDSFFDQPCYPKFKSVSSYLNKNTGIDLFEHYPGNDDLVANEPQIGSHNAANATLDSFLESRVERYLYGISSPIKSIESSSRLSPYLAYGLLSLRQVMQKAWEIDDPKVKRSKNGFISRLYWHSHFVQKFETEPEHEVRAVNKSLDNMRRDEFCFEKFERWQLGQTGVPFVDACMRMLHHYGWINFRMRAMLTAFSSYHLWLHWQKPAAHLAQMFIDYEPGIHYPQIQMQSGVTGINPFRIYNPVKQAEKYDPKHHFVRQWLPELAHVPDSFVQQPWLYPNLKEDIYFRIESPDLLAKRAKVNISDFYQKHKLKEETNRVIKTHASRAKKKSTKRKSVKNSKPNTQQQSLF